MKGLKGAILRWLEDFTEHGIFTTDERLVIRSWNRWMEQHSGHAVASMVGRELLEVYPDLVDRGLDRCYRQALSGHTTFIAQRLYDYLIPMPPTSPDAGFSHMPQNAYIAPLIEGDRVIGTITVIEDVTGRVAREDALQISHRFLEIINRHTETDPMLQECAAEIQRFTGCAAVGIRLLDDKGNMPYEACIGFGRELYEEEHLFLARAGRYICTRVITGASEPRLPFYTEGGSFHTNAASRLLATLPEEETCQLCMPPGYESVALVPIRLGDRILGLIHVADPRENMLPPAKVELLERLGQELAVGVQRTRTEETLALQMKRLQALIQASRVMTASLALDQVLAEILTLASEVVPSDYTGVALVDEKGEVTGGVDDIPNIPSISYRIRERGLTDWIVRTRRPIIIDEIRPDGTFEPSLGDDGPSVANPEIIKAGIRSLAGLPLIAKGRLLGVLYLHSRHSWAFHGQESLLMSFANQVAVAIENARLFEETQRRATLLEALNAIITAATSAQDLRALLEATLDHTLQALGLSMGGIWLQGSPGSDPNGRLSTLYVLQNLPPELGIAMGHAARSMGLDLVHTDIAEDWEAVKGQWEPIAPIILRFGIRASLTAPVMANGRRIGGLSVASPEPRAWTQEEITLVEAVGRQIGAAAERLRLLEETQAHADLMSHLASLGDSLNRPLAVEDVIAAIGQGALTLSGTNRAAVYLHNPDHTITCVWAHGLSQTYLDQVTARIHELPGRTLLQEPKPLLIPDVMALPPDSPIRDLAQAEGFRAYAVWPLAYEGRTIAGIACYYDAPYTWSEAEQEVMETFARQAAIALENARLYSSLQEANEQLQKALQAKEEMIQNVSHELRTPLTLIQGYVELLKDGYLGSLSPQQAEAVHSIHANSRRLHFMIHRLLTLQTLTPESFQYISMSPISWLKDTVERWRQQAEETGIRLSLDLPPTLPLIEGDPKLLIQVMDNLIDNAIKFSPEGGEVRIRACQEENELIISVSDQGIGLSPEEVPHVFERFYQADGGTTRRFGGMGIGLTLCKAIIEGHCGRIWAQSEGKGKGSTFYISLPLHGSSCVPRQPGGKGESREGFPPLEDT